MLCIHGRHGICIHCLTPETQTCGSAIADASGPTATSRPPTVYDVPPGATICGITLTPGPATIADVARQINEASEAGVVAVIPPGASVVHLLPKQVGADNSLGFVASQIARGFPVSVDGALDLGALVTPADAAHCALCGTPEPPDAYALGWRSQTCDTPPDFHALLCPTCQQGDGDRLSNAR